jgi:hypothetical protein
MNVWLWFLYQGRELSVFAENLAFFSAEWSYPEFLGG